jgi:2,3-bisphosphoglycerate-independent phosphoglycerate mutase
MGAGRVVYQDLTRIDKSIKDGDFFEKPALVDAMTRCQGDKHALHLVGLVSPNGIHSHTRHLYALIDMAARHKLTRVFVQGFSDGRRHVAEWRRRLFRRARAGHEQGWDRASRSVGGRYYGMDRDNRWERTKKAYESMVSGQGPRGRSAVEYIRKSYESGVTGRIRRTRHDRRCQRPADRTIRDGDSVIFFNFRSDRARQLTRALALDGSTASSALLVRTSHDRR